MISQLRVTIATWKPFAGLSSRLRIVPFRRQLDNSDCAAACLAMMLSFYGRHTNADELRDFCVSSRDGTSVYTLTQAAKAFDVTVKAYATKLEKLNLMLLPAIVHWKSNHYVIVERCTNAGFVIVDPAVGRQNVSTDVFREAFTGVVLTVKPNENFKKQKIGKEKNLSVWRVYTQQMFSIPGVRKALIKTMLASIILQALGLLPPLFTKVLVDTILPKNNASLLNTLVWAGILLAASLSLMTLVRLKTLIHVQARVDQALMHKFFEKLLGLRYEFFQNHSSGDLIMRLGSNSVLRDVLTNQLLATALDVSLISIYIVSLILVEPNFALLVVIIAICQLLILSCTQRRIHRLAQCDLDAQAKTQSFQVDALAGVTTLKASGMESWAVEKWSKLYKHQLASSIRSASLNAIVMSCLTGLSTFAPLLLLWYGAQKVFLEEMTLGTVFALLALAGALLAPLASVVAAGQQFQVVGAHLERIKDVLNAHPEQSSSTQTASFFVNGHISLNNINFRHNPEAAFIFDNLSVDIKPGEKVAVVGPTGSGKSTLAMLILGLYKPSSGKVFIDHTDLEMLDYSIVRRQLGVVLQEPSLFSGTIRENIMLYDLNASSEDIILSAKLAAVHDEIIKMPLGYNTPISENGKSLSGGQKQRIALARALLRKPKVLILDEATSHLDPYTEQVIDKNLSQLRCTRIVIAHRESTIQNADHIISLTGDQKHYQGTYKQLLSEGRLNHFSSRESHEV